MFVVIHILDYSLIFVNGFSLNSIYERRGKMILKKIEALCQEKGINISKLEKECGIGNGTIRGWEKSSPRADNLKKVASYFGVPMEELLEDEPDQEEGSE